ncbi:hypothetical protein [Novosphingobium sp. BW1]|uniref:hypothetical protein n=1 Tax=Novosphingobium sp. BW1 TaxID=2592621 RepID=UPI0011DEAA61|nr:hypothetical protein [Novosphingobium sp. BW1]TYC86156.1 hypothetical protein FMM79_15820 [Novosphingobium sp. BW1]
MIDFSGRKWSGEGIRTLPPTLARLDCEFVGNFKIFREIPTGLKTGLKRNLGRFGIRDGDKHQHFHTVVW